MEKKPFFKQLLNILQEKKKKCFDDFDTEWRITTGLRERGIRLLCNMIENKKEEITSIKDIIVFFFLINIYKDIIWTNENNMNDLIIKWNEHKMQLNNTT